VPEPVVSVVIVSWNTQALLRSCIESLGVSSSSGTLEVVVVDNASTDGSASMVRGDYPEVKLVETGANVGYSRAINRGLSYCTGDFVCLLNSDTEMALVALQTMVGYVRDHPEVGLVGPALLNPDGSHQSSKRRFPFFWPPLSLLVGRQFELKPPTAPQHVDWLVGACLVLRRRVLQKLGGMDESYPFYGEDMELAYRVHQQGLEVVLLPAASVVHVGEGSSQTAMSPTVRVRSYYEAPLRFMRKNSTPADVLLWRLSRGTVAVARYATVRWFRRRADTERELAIWSSVVRLCVNGAPTTWSLRSSR
jgi:N-acetylglucosaminyl-diphospho-decaprenol L-rhamnosyltransferase